ncbi:hypothetical protein [Hoylesella enoeca]|nr:hypothetical protein [Hoylesella enoeca]
MEKKITKSIAKKQKTTEEPKRKYSKTWEAAMKYKGILYVNDPKFLV